MPIARFQMPDGRIARFEVPEGTTPEQAQSMVESELSRMQRDPAGPPKDIGRAGFDSALRETLQGADWGTRNIAGAGTALSNLWYGGKQMAGAAYDAMRAPKLQELVTGKRPTLDLEDKIRANRIISEEAPIGSFVGNAALTAVPFGLAGSSVRAAGAVGAGYGALQPIEGATSIGDVAKGKAINAAIGGTAGAGGQFVANKAAGYLQRKAAELAARKSQNATRDAALKAAQAEGFVVPPDTVNPTMTNRALTGAAGKLTTQQQASAKNAERGNALVRKALGLSDDTPLDDATLNAYRAQKAAPYQELEQIGAGDAVEALKQARFDAKEQWKFYNRSGNPEARKAAAEADKLAASYEQFLDQFARSAGRSDLVPKLREARKAIAMSYDVEKALNEVTGNVDLRVLAKSPFLSGELKTAASFAKAFPKLAQSPQTMGSLPGVSPLDFATAGVMGASGAGGWAGLPFLRPVVRSAILSRPAQRLLANPSYAVPAPLRVGGSLLKYAPVGSTALAVPALNQ